jgi:hypothetical protein
MMHLLFEAGSALGCFLRVGLDKREDVLERRINCCQQNTY